MKDRLFPLRITVLLGVMLLALSLLSCATDEGIVGAWEITDIVFDGEKLNDLNPCIYYFYEDGTGSKFIMGEEEFSFQYSYDGTTCILYNLKYPDGSTEAGTYGEMTVKGNKMTVVATEGGVTEKITLRRIKSSTSMIYHTPLS